MGSIFFSVTTFFLSFAILATPSFGKVNQVFIHPNYTGSYYQYVDTAGVFLASHNGNFSAAIFNPGSQQTKFYLCVLHVASNTVIWSANRDYPFSKSGRIFLTPQGLTIADQASGATIKWSTPALNSSVAAMFLTDMGNLALIDQFNNSIWQSFDHPTNTIVIGQQISVGSLLVSNAFLDSDISSGDYQFLVSSYNGLFTWKGLNYWKLSMEANAYVNSNAPISFMALNDSGLYLLGENESVVVIHVVLSRMEFRIAKSYC